MGAPTNRTCCLLGLCVIAIVAPQACGSDDGSALPPPAGTGGTAGKDSGPDSQDATLIKDTSLDLLGSDTGACTTGQSCGDGGICAKGVCCAAELACGDQCCSQGQLCSFYACVVPGADCTDSSDCPSTHYCDYSLGEPVEAGVPEADSGSCVGGAVVLQGKCMPRPPTCAEDAGPSDAGDLSCLEKCEYHPQGSSGTLDPVVKYSWGDTTGNTDVMMAPIVIELDDDDCDGKVTERDIPEIVFSTFSSAGHTGPGVLHAISIIQGKVVEKWSASDTNADSHLAAGDIHPSSGNEVVACTDTAVKAHASDGKLLWTSPALRCFQPSIADLDGDGSPEVIVEGGILNGTTGQLKTAFTPELYGTFLVSDLDGDNQLDIVTSSAAYHADGSLFVDTGDTGYSWGGEDFESGPALADFDKDGRPEVVATQFMTHSLAIWHYDPAQPKKFSFLRHNFNINANLDPNLCLSGSAGTMWGGGPVTIGDFNVDGYPDIAFAGGVGYIVIDGHKVMDSAVSDLDTVLWTQVTHDCSSAATGSSLFDFNGDGAAEVVYSDEYYLRIYQGADGKELFKTCNTTGTLTEYPLVADVDNDGQADIVVASNAYALVCEGTRQSGIRVFSSASGSWVRTRRVWNEHAYHITNVGEDGKIPAQELPNWVQPGLNNFRQNKQPGKEFAAPDAVVSVKPKCTTPYTLVATVRNVGEASLPAGLVVEFFQGTPSAGTKLGEGKTSAVLWPAESELVLLPLPNPPSSLLQGTESVSVRVTPPSSVHECRTDNNTSPPTKVGCGQIK